MSSDLKSQNKKEEISFSDYHFSITRRLGHSACSKIHNFRRLKFAGLDRSAGNTILDCGCGSGEDSVIMAKWKNYVIGTDVSREALRIAKENALLSNVEVEFVLADSENLPFRNASFDTCICMQTLHHFSSIDYVLMEIERILCSPGKIVLFEPNGSNIVFKMSERVEDLVRPFLKNIGVDTPNEHIHDLSFYLDSLRKAGFFYIGVKVWTEVGYAPLSSRSILISFLTKVRYFLFLLACTSLPSPFKGTNILVVGTKR